MKKNVYLLDGASVVEQCSKAGLVDEMIIHLVPVLLGNGICLFDNIGTEHFELEEEKLIKAPSVTHLKFRVLDKLHREICCPKNEIVKGLGVPL